MSGDHNMNQTDLAWRKRQIALDKMAENARELGLDYEPEQTSMIKDLKALIEDLRLNHEYCPKEVILRAADELEKAQRTWIDLTEQEATYLWESTDEKDGWELLKRVEAKLKELNT